MPSLFLTYGPHDERTVEKVKEIHDYLRTEQSIHCHVDYKDLRTRSMNVNMWINDNLGRDFVLVGIGKGYTEYTCSYLSTDDTDDPNRSYNGSIFDRLQSEIIHNGCWNKRYIPILLDGATDDDLPSILRTTTLYHWPKDQQKLLDRLLGRQEFKPPLRGSRPIAVVKSVLG
ncbi:E3 ubiquitin ligase TRAF3IP2-like [Styela clava]